ncbi:hypothetical protein D3C76_906940 [compost metagenome]
MTEHFQAGRDSPQARFRPVSQAVETTWFEGQLDLCVTPQQAERLAAHTAHCQVDQLVQNPFLNDRHIKLLKESTLRIFRKDLNSVAACGEAELAIL